MLVSGEFAVLFRALSVHLRRLQVHVAARNHGGDRVLVHHLADGIAKHNDELIEGLDLTLELDAVDEVYGDRDTLLAQRVEVRVLKGIPFDMVLSSKSDARSSETRTD